MNNPQGSPLRAPAAPQADPLHWVTLRECLHADCKVFKVFKRHCQHPSDKRSGDFYIIGSNDWVQVLALTAANQLILVQQYRFGSDTLSWEVPGGIIDAGDLSPAAAAARELLEETGYSGDDPESIGWCYPNPAIQTNRSHFILIKNCRRIAEPTPDCHEELAVREYPVDTVMHMAARGEIRHSIALNALFYLQHWLTRTAT